MSAVIVTFLERGKRLRGPGGNWYSYVARYDDSTTPFVGYGTTERMARDDLTKQKEGNGLIEGDPGHGSTETTRAED